MAFVRTKKYKRPDGSIQEATVIDFYDQHGKRRLKTIPEGTTKKRIKDRLREIEDFVGNETFLPAKKIPTVSAVVKDWLEYKQPNLRSTTYDVMAGHVRKHFHADEEQKTTMDLDVMKINRFGFATLGKWMREKRDSGMHILTLRKVLVTLNQILRYAVRHKYMDHNPLVDAERPRSQGHEGKDKQIRVLTADQIKTLEKWRLACHRSGFTISGTHAQVF